MSEPDTAVLIHEGRDPGDHEVGVPDRVLKVHLHAPSNTLNIKMSYEPSFNFGPPDEITMDAREFLDIAGKIRVRI